MFTEVVPLVSLIVVEEMFRLLELLLLPLLEVLLLTSKVACPPGTERVWCVLPPAGTSILCPLTVTWVVPLLVV